MRSLKTKNLLYYRVSIGYMKHELEELELLDLKKCHTVNDIIKGMDRCSFGARCLGEVTDTIEEIVKEHSGSTMKNHIHTFNGSRQSDFIT